MESSEEKCEQISHKTINNILVISYKDATGTEIEREEYVKDLGVIMNERMEFEGN